MPGRVPRMTMPRRDGRSRDDLPLSERVLQGLGAHPDFADALLGDLAEERAWREAQGSVIVARWWYLREAFRSAPHLVLNAMRHGGSRGRARAALVLGAIALVPTIAVIAFLVRNGPPAQLVLDGQNGRAASEGLVLNGTHPVRLASRVLDANGNVLRSAEVRYRWSGGIPMRVSPSGVVTCKHSGDALVSAAVGTVTRTLLIRCRPVRDIYVDFNVRLVAGEVGKDLAFTAHGLDGRAVDLLAGELHVEDSTIATLDGIHVRPLSPGQTDISIHVGDRETEVRVTVFERVRSLAGLRPDQRNIVALVRLAPGDTIRWPLPKGLFWLEYWPGIRDQSAPDMAVDGPLMCMPSFGPSNTSVGCMVRGPGASIRITRPAAARGEIVGNLALEMRDP